LGEPRLQGLRDSRRPWPARSSALPLIQRRSPDGYCARPDDTGEEQHVPTSLDTLTLDEILTPNVNLADFLSDNVLSGIGQKVVRDVAIDEKSREDWLGRYQKWLDMAMQVREAKNTRGPRLRTSSSRC
jgi:hypothetical protein